MTRRHLLFDVDGDACAAALDMGSRNTGLLIVSGGNETRAGAFGGNAALARKLAARGYPVFRFDRRGVGDSEGPNSGYRGSAPDIAAATSAFRVEVSGLTKIIAFGNCDGASALMLQSKTKFDGQVLANPWTFPDDSDASAISPQAIRGRYASRLRDPAQWVRMLRGGVSVPKLAKGLSHAFGVGNRATQSEWASRAAELSDRTRILIAGRDRTGTAFLELCDKTDPRVFICPAADHGFSGEAAQWLEDQLVTALEQADKFDMR